MTNKKHYWPYFLLITLSEIAYGQTTTIITDGSLGESNSGQVTVTPHATDDHHYEISSSLGEVKNNNLFHSFETFNIGRGDTATFTGDPTINHIITRVTGGDATSIYGTLKSDITNANLWLLNRNGVIFGKNSKIDVQGTVNISTSDSLTFVNGDHFTSQLSSKSILSAVEPSAFGIISAEAGDINFDLYQGDTFASRYQGLQLYGRNIRLKNTFIGQHYEVTDKRAIGDITLTASDSIIGEGIKITNRNGESRDATGNITMTAGQDIILSNGKVITDNSRGNAGNIILTAKQGDIQLKDSVYVRANSTAGKAGDITVTAGHTISLSGKRKNNPTVGSRLVSSKIGNSNAQASTIKIKAKHLTLNDEADIRTDSEKPTYIDPDGINSNSGDILIDVAGNIRLDNDSHITSESDNPNTNAGNIKVTANTLLLNNSKIRSKTFVGEDNRAGNIDINSDFVILTDNSTIDSSAANNTGGAVNIAGQLYTISGDSIIDTASGLTLSGLRVEREDARLNAEFAEDPNQLRNSCHYETTVNPLSSVQRLNLSPAPTGLLAIYTESTALDHLDNPLDNPLDKHLNSVDQLLAQSQQLQQQGQYNEARRTLRKIYGASTSNLLKSHSLKNRASNNHAPTKHAPTSTALTTLSSSEQARLLNTLGNNAIALNGGSNINKSINNPVSKNASKNGNHTTDTSAEKLLQASLALASKEKQPALEAAAANNLANAYYYRQKTAEASTLYQHSIRLNEQQGNIKHALRASANLSRLYVDTRQLKAFEESSKRSIALLEQLASTNADKITALIHLGHSWQQALNDNIGQTQDYLTQDDLTQDYLTQAYALFEQAQTLALSQQNWWLASYAQGHLAQLYLYEQRIDEALTLTEYALSNAYKSHSADALYRWHGQQGRLYRQQGRTNQAMAAYRQAIAIIEESRQSSRVRYGSQRRYFQQQISPIYRELVDLTLDSAARVDDSATTEQLLYAARATLEKLNTRQLENYLNDECVTNYRKKYKELDQVADNAAVIYPIVLNNRLEIIVSLPTGKKDKPRKLKRYPVAIAQQTLHDLIEQYRTQLIDKHTNNALAVSQQLYDLLVRPYSKDLQETTVTTLVFVPDDGLRDLPFAALHNGQNYLIRDYALAAASSLSIVDPKAITPEKSSVLSAGVAAAVDTLSPLPWVPYELESIGRLYPGERLLDADFNLENFRQSLQKRPYNIVHIASHAEFFPESSQGFIQTHSGRISMSELKTLLQTKKYQETPVELLVLSACQTASGNRAEAFGLSGVAIQAGVRSVLGSLWDIDDEVAFHLMSEFYQALQSGRYSKAEALQKAQLALIDNKVFAHPYFWSPMMLMNNWL